MEDPLNIGKQLVDYTGRLTESTLEGLQGFLASSLSWSARQLETLSDSPWMKESELAEYLRSTGRSLLEVRVHTTDAFTDIILSSNRAFARAMKSLNLADESVRKRLFDHVPEETLIGASMDPLSTEKVKPSLRSADGNDLSPAEAADLARTSGKDPILLLPGLFSDESLWQTGENPLAKTLKHYGEPVYFRFNPSGSVVENGRYLNEILHEFHEAFYSNGQSRLSWLRKKKKHRPLHIIAYSQGGLILRSALYQSKKADYPWRNNTGKVILVSSPDAGSEIEKLGFFLGMGLERSPLMVLQLMILIARQQKEVYNQYALGIIRPEDENNPNAQTGYYGELEEQDAYQIYSLILKEGDPRTSWLGDGVVERASLSYLSIDVFEQEGPGRSVMIPGHSHFHILHNNVLDQILQDLLAH